MLDERIDDLIVASVFGEAAAVLDEERRAYGDEFALIEAFAKALGEALGSASPLSARWRLRLKRSLKRSQTLERLGGTSGSRSAFLAADERRSL